MIHQLNPSLDFQPIPEEVVIAINDACSVINHWATKKGWNDSVADEIESHYHEGLPGELRDKLLLLEKMSQHMLFVTEVAEGAEFLRKPGPDDHIPSIPGEHAELADLLIRVFHYCGRRNIDLGVAIQAKHQYNISRPYRHGKAI